MNYIRAMKVQLLKIATGIITSIILYFIMQEIQDNHLISSMVAIVLLMAIWWITEAVPLAVTSLLPVFLYPATNIMSTTDIAPSYMNQVIFLFIGGFIIAFAMERWNLHKRIALRIILLIGTDVNRILLGMMVSSYLLSMWISNTATTMMMLPTAFAVIARVAGLVASKEIGKQFGKGVLLGIAYSASIGGTATLIGTPPNLIFQAQYISTFGAENAIPFATWFQFGLPTSLILLAAAYIILKKMFCSGIKTTVDNLPMFEEEYKALGKMRFEEKVVAIDFVILAFLWFFRQDLEIGSLVIPGWSDLFPSGSFFQDSTVAVFMASLLFMIPSTKKEDGMIISWKACEEPPIRHHSSFWRGIRTGKRFCKLRSFRGVV